MLFVKTDARIEVDAQLVSDTRTVNLTPWVYEMAQRKQVDTARDVYIRKQKQRVKPHYEPTELDATILTYVMEYYFLTAWQLVNLHYSPGSYTRAATKLQVLSGNHPKIPSEAYLHRRALHHLTTGNPTYVYSLGTDGINYLRSCGFPDLKRRFRPGETNEVNYFHLIHALNVNDMLIAGRTLPKVAPDITLASWRHDIDLQKEPSLVEFDRSLPRLGGMEQLRVRLVPDGMLDFRMKPAGLDKERRRIILPEIDRGTETSQELFKKKILAYIHYALPGGGFSEQFGENVNKRVAYFITKGGDNRLSTLLRWCEDVLSENDLEHEFNLFRFITVDPVIEKDAKTGKEKRLEALNADPNRLFLAPVAYKPFHEEPDTLLWKS